MRPLPHSQAALARLVVGGLVVFDRRRCGVVGRVRLGLVDRWRVDDDGFLLLVARVEYRGDNLGFGGGGLDLRVGLGFGYGFGGFQFIAGEACVDARDVDVALCLDPGDLDFAVDGGLGRAVFDVVVGSAFGAEHYGFPFRRGSYGHLDLSLPYFCMTWARARVLSTARKVRMYFPSLRFLGLSTETPMSALRHLC